MNCTCGHAKEDHHQGRSVCRKLDCDCGSYRPKDSRWSRLGGGATRR